MNIVCNENVRYSLWIESEREDLYRFTADSGYALWRDNEEGNLDENGEPLCYWCGITTGASKVEEFARHIQAKPIDDTMEVW